MFRDIGEQIRHARNIKGIGLNDFAQKIGVSPAYLSNLETGKTDTISIFSLDNLNKELNLFPINQMKFEELTLESDERTNEVFLSLFQLQNEDRETFDHVLLLIEQALKIVSVNKKAN
ncbi:helix-turn-helix domain-containing protein [Bacillus sp. F19]|nr:helix-turn-helix domain-containing protein [Bacillus sp. F19]